MTATCPYCRAPFEEADEIVSCQACATPHHADCYAENAGCTVFGCAKAPVDEPGVTVSAAEIAHPRAQASAAAAALPAPTPPPPRREGATTAIAPPPRISLNGTPYPLQPAPRPRGFSFGGYNAEQSQVPPAPYIPRRSRITYILLGVLLGAFGGHNFYAGYTKRAAIQLLLTVFTCFFGAIVSWIWALYEVCTVRQDDDGIPFV
jgi:TM2 domain-containing membrane protein YozV